MSSKEIIFIYNADSSLLAAISDFVHKIASPVKYECKLCMLTYGDLSLKQNWSDFLETLDYPVRFFHRDEWRQRYPEFISVSLPAAFVCHQDNMGLLISHEEMNAIEDLESLKILVLEKMSAVVV